ncbi:MAG: hypothetical protein RIT81_22260 [Deltaproteobacteria bacterium]
MGGSRGELQRVLQAGGDRVILGPSVVGDDAFSTLKRLLGARALVLTSPSAVDGGGAVVGVTGTTNALGFEGVAIQVDVDAKLVRATITLANAELRGQPGLQVSQADLQVELADGATPKISGTLQVQVGTTAPITTSVTVPDPAAESSRWVFTASELPLAGTKVALTLSLTATADGDAYSLELERTDGAWTVKELLESLGSAELPDKLADALDSTALKAFAVEVEPSRRRFGLAAQGTVFDVETRIRASVSTQYGAPAVAMNLRMALPKTELRAVLSEQLGVDPTLVDLVPDLGIAPREIGYDALTKSFVAGGEITLDGEAIDFRFDQYPGGFAFETGSLYAELEGETHAGISLEAIFGLLPVPADFLSSLESILPGSLGKQLLGTRIASVEAASIRADATQSRPASITFDAVCQIPMPTPDDAAATEVATLAIEHETGSDGTSWSIALAVPFLDLNLTNLAVRLGIDVADALPSVEVGFRGLRVVSAPDTTGQSQLQITIDADVVVGEIDAAIRVDISRDPSVRMVLGDLVFLLSRTTTDGGATTTAQVTSSADSPLSLHRLSSVIGFDIDPALPDLKLKEATLKLQPGRSGFGGVAVVQIGDADLRAASASERIAVPNGADGETERVYLLGAQLTPAGAPLSLRSLPVVGRAMPGPEVLGVQRMEVRVASSDLSSETARTLDDLASNALLAEPVPDGAAIAVPAGFGFDASFTVLGNTQSIRYGMGPATATDATPSATPAATPTTTPGVPARKPKDGTKWITVGKAIGPVRLERIGLRYADRELLVALDAALTFSGLTLSAQGLGIRSPIDRFDPTPELAGLGLAMATGPLTVGGGFVGVDADLPEFTGRIYAGELIVGAQKFSLKAIGAYAEVGADHKPSVFAFLRITTPLGGPAYFFVTGLSGGFGYNWKLRIPDKTEVTRFPLFPGAESPPGAGAPTTNDALSSATGLIQPVGGRPPWLVPKSGEYWLAAGLQFTSFQLLQTDALLVAKFGRDFEVALLGITSLVLPRTPPGAAALTPIVDARLGLRVYVSPKKGVIEASARIDPRSYIFDRACRLQGGFSFYSWFAGPHQGDFVVTLGGYHSKYRPPAHYPTEPRVGFRWQRGSLEIKGSMYFALTPDAGMAGGSLSATYTSGKLKAWFKTWADFLVFWKPLRYDLAAAVSIGASYRVKVGPFKKTLKASLGASLKVWGPPFAGRARVKWTIISFTVPFGSSRPPSTKKLRWSQFTSAFLPQEPDVRGRWVVAQVEDGLIGTDPDDGRWLVNPGRLRITTTTTIPATRITAGGAPLPTTTPKLGVRPMGRKELDVEHDVSVWKLTTGAPERVKVRYEPILDGVPTALWSRKAGPKSAKQIPKNSVIRDVPVGVRITLPPLDTKHLAKSDRLDLDVVAYGDEDVNVDLDVRAPEVLRTTTLGADDSVAAAEVALQTAEDDAALAARRSAFVSALETAGIELPELVSAPPPAELGGGTTVEGVAFTAEEVQAVLHLVRTASFEVLDTDVELRADAARSIVEHRALRPIRSLEQLAQIPYVGPAALKQLAEAATNVAVAPPPAQPRYRLRAAARATTLTSTAP